MSIHSAQLAEFLQHAVQMRLSRSGRPSSDEVIANVRLLIAAGADPNGLAHASRARPLIEAARLNDPVIIELLVSNGAQLDVTDDQGWTPLIHAAHMHATEAVRCLLALGADPNRAAKDGSTALERARWQRGHWVQ
jgi:ankyrin repeat protein